MDLCSKADPHEWQGDSLIHHGLHQWLQGNLCPSTWSTFSLFFCAELGVCRAVSLTFSHSSLPATLQQFLLFLKDVMAEVLPVGSALAWLCPVARPSWSRLKLTLLDMEAAPNAFSQEPALQSPPSKTLPCKPSIITYLYPSFIS